MAKRVTGAVLGVLLLAYADARIGVAQTVQPYTAFKQAIDTLLTEQR